MRAGLFVLYITNFSARTVKEFYGKIQGKNLETGHLRLCGRNREQRIRRRRRNVGGAPARKDGHALVKGARHGDFGHSSRFAAHFYSVCDQGNLRFFRAHSHGSRRYVRGIFGRETSRKTPSKDGGNPVRVSASLCRRVAVLLSLSCGRYICLFTFIFYSESSAVFPPAWAWEGEP